MCRGGWTSQPESLRVSGKAPVVHASPEARKESLRGLLGAAGGSVVKVDSCHVHRVPGRVCMRKSQKMATSKDHRGSPCVPFVQWFRKAEAWICHWK